MLEAEFDLETDELLYAECDFNMTREVREVSAGCENLLLKNLNVKSKS